MDFATLLMRSKSIRKAKAEAPAMISFGFLLQYVVIDVFVSIEAVAHHVEPLAAHVQRHAMREVAAFGEAHPHDGVARFQHGEEHPLVSLRTGVRLHVGGFGSEQLLYAVDGELLNHIDELTATVVTLAGITLGVLVGQLRALRLHHGRRGVVFRGDQLDVILLALVFFLDGGEQLGIDLIERETATFKHGGDSKK